MCDKFFESVGVTEDLLFAGGGCVNLIHQVGEKVEGGFLVHFMLSQFFRQYTKEEDHATALLILNHHSKGHWISVASKLGLNLTPLEEKGALIVIDLMKESCLLSLKGNTVETSNDYRCLKNLYLRCEKAIQDLKKSGGKRILLIVEDLTNFLGADSNGFPNSERDLIEFVMKLRALSIAESKTCSITIVGLAQSPQIPSDSLELTRFAKTVTNALATINFEVSPLSTGFSAQVTGFLKVVCNPRKINSEKRLEAAFIRNYHFKLENNGARATAL